jgi:hypothetical protein
MDLLGAVLVRYSRNFMRHHTSLPPKTSNFDEQLASFITTQRMRLISMILAGIRVLNLVFLIMASSSSSSIARKAAVKVKIISDVV